MTGGFEESIVVSVSCMESDRVTGRALSGRCLGSRFISQLLFQSPAWRAIVSLVVLCRVVVSAQGL